MIRTEILKVTTNQGLVKGQKRPEIKLQRDTARRKVETKERTLESQLLIEN